MLRVSLLAMVVGTFGACASSSVRDDSMTAHEHRMESKRHDEEAERVAAPDPSIGSLDGRPYHVVSSYAGAWGRHEREAVQHRAAAERLEAAAGAACGELSHDERAACPFETARVDAVATGEHGVALRVQAELPPERLRAAIQCHLAESQVVAPEGDDGATCPPYVDGIEVDVFHSDERGTWIILRTETPAARDELGRRVRTLFPEERSAP